MGLVLELNPQPQVSYFQIQATRLALLVECEEGNKLVKLEFFFFFFLTTQPTSPPFSPLTHEPMVISPCTHPHTLTDDPMHLLLHS